MQLYTRDPGLSRDIFRIHNLFMDWEIDKPAAGVVQFKRKQNYKTEVRT